MKNFMIGQYGGFDQGKYERDFKEGFYGIKACLFDSEEDIQQLQRESQAKGFAIGVHFPLRAGQFELRDALFMDAHDQTRAEAFERIERELAFMSFIQPTYVLFHYPKPVILDDRVDWNVWRFHDCRDYVWEQAYSEEGWAPIEDYLTIIRKENPHVKIMFEHRSDLVTDGQLERCYRWVEQLLSEPDESTSSNNSI